MKVTAKNIHSETKLSFESFRLQAIVLVIIAFIFYTNSLFNEYALDDGPIISYNEYVNKGFKGIPKILKTDSFDSYYKSLGAGQQLTGGRYRPLSVVMFAIEQQLFGSNSKTKPENDLAFFRHLINVVLYVLSIILLLHFLRTFIFQQSTLIPFITCLLFLIHPIHTEVVANIKSRDEILSFLFIVLTFIYVFRYKEYGAKKHLGLSLVFYFLALLSKEYAIALLALIPILLYIVKKETLKASITFTIPFFVIALAFILLRFQILGSPTLPTDPDILNAPYKWATASQTWATKIEVLSHYFKLLLYPFPLSSDYSYNTIPYADFSDGKVWFSIILHLTMIIATLVLFFKRNILAFAFAFYLINLLLVSNLLFDIGATMGERLIYHSSLGFSMAIAIGLSEVTNRFSASQRKMLLIGAGILVITWCGIKTINRNPDWKNNTTLFIADVKTVPNSALANSYAGLGYLQLAGLPENEEQIQTLTDSSIIYLNKAVSIHKSYVLAYINLEAAYYGKQQYAEAEKNWKLADSLSPNHPLVHSNYLKLADTYYRIAIKYGPTDKKAGVDFMKKAIALDSTNSTYLSTLAEAYHQYGMSFGSGNPTEAIKHLKDAVRFAPKNALYWYNLGGVNYTLKDFEQAKQAWMKTLELEPTNQLAKQGLDALPN